MLFGYAFDGPYSRRERLRAPAVRSHHRVWFHPLNARQGHTGLVTALGLSDAQSHPQVVPEVGRTPPSASPFGP